MASPSEAKTIVDLKPCPFCGHRAVLRNSGLQARNRSMASVCPGDFFTTWEVSCSWCGTKKGGNHYRTEYIFSDIGTLNIVGNDRRTEAIEEWNRRSNDVNA